VMLPKTIQTPPRSTVVTLTDAQIRALPTAGGGVGGEGQTVLVAAPGAGRLLIPVSVVVLTNLTASYGNVSTSAQLCFNVGTLNGYWDATSTLYQAIDAGVAEFLGATAGNRQNLWRFQTVPYARQKAGDTTTYFVQPQTARLADTVNQPLFFYCFNSTGPFTGGHARNTLTIAVIYELFDLTSKQFGVDFTQQT
jgi:hypothetical protein